MISKEVDLFSPDMLQICPSTYDEDFKEQNSTIKDIMTFGTEHHLRITTHKYVFNFLCQDNHLLSRLCVTDYFSDPVLEFDELHLKAPALAEKYSTSYIGKIIRHFRPF